MNKNFTKILLIIAFAFYIAMVLKLTLINRHATVIRIRLTPFWEYQELFRGNLAGLLFSISIEFLQLITARGLCEFDDVFNNTLGAVIGYLGYRIVSDWM